MRFAISLLLVLACASVIGTVTVQNDTAAAYINQFGGFWGPWFVDIGVTNIYSTPWFLTILAFLVTSTSLCLWRNTPKMWRQARGFTFPANADNLRRQHYFVEFATSQTATDVMDRAGDMLRTRGFRCSEVERDTGRVLAARRGASQRLGYIAAHLGIVVICLGALLDSSLWMQVPLWLQQKRVYYGGGLIADVPAASRFGMDNPSFRGNLFIPPDSLSRYVVVNMGDGVVLQELPFGIKLKSFRVDSYSNGMPSQFVSELEIEDRRTPPRDSPFSATLRVNEPFHYQGISLYQSSFGDGGSALTFRAYPLFGGASPFSLNGVVGDSTEVENGGTVLRYEFSDFKLVNVENIALESLTGRGLGGALAQMFSGRATVERSKTLQNVGPSFTYKVRDASGQAREYQQYQLPVVFEGSQVLIAGTRSSAAEAFRYVRIPVDAKGGVEDWMRLKNALSNPGMYAIAAKRFAVKNQVKASDAVSQDILAASAERLLTLFGAGLGGRYDSNTLAGGKDGQKGFAAFSPLFEQAPVADRERSVKIVLDIFEGSLWELWQLSREKAGLPPPTVDPANQQFFRTAMLALSDIQFFGAPLWLELEQAVPKQASVLQATRSPGQGVVYFGCALLVIGVFLMLFMREWRVWLWYESKESKESGGNLVFALTSPRQLADTAIHFAALRTALESVIAENAK